MKTVVMVAVAALLSGVARADWKDLAPGMDEASAWRTAGAPLLQNRGRGADLWTYDNGGYILFERGRLSYAQPPKPAEPAKPAPSAAVARAAVAQKPRPAAVLPAGAPRPIAVATAN